MTSVTYIPIEIKFKGHYFELKTQLFVGNLTAAKDDAKKLRQQYRNDPSIHIRRFECSVITYECKGLK